MIVVRGVKRAAPFTPGTPRPLRLPPFVGYDAAMELSDEAITSFADIWEREFGERLAPDRARIEASNLMELAWLIVQPLPGEAGYKEKKPNKSP